MTALGLGLWLAGGNAPASSAQAWPVSFAITQDYCGWGSSTMNGLNSTTRSPLYVMANEDTTGADYYDASGSTPASGPPSVIVNGGAGGTTSTQIETAVTGGSTREKAAYTYIQLGGNYEAVNNPVPGILTNAADIATLLGHNNFLHVPKHTDGATASGHIDWCRLREITYLLEVQYPGRVSDTALLFRTYSTGDSGDDTAQALDQIPPSLDEDTAHPNLAGNRVLSERDYSRWAYCRQNAHPYIPYQRRRSAETTNQTNGGLVCTVYHDTGITGSLTDATFSITDNSDFSIAVETGEIKIRRASGTYLGAGYYNLTVRATKNGVYMDSVVQVFLQEATPSGNYAANTGGQMLIREGTVDGVQNVTKLSIALGVRPLSGWDAMGTAQKQFIFFGNNKVDIATKASTNQNLGVVLRNSAGTTIFNLDTPTGTGFKEGRGLNGIQWYFGAWDWDNAVYNQAINANAAQTTGYTMPTAGTESCALFHVASSLPHYLLSGGPGTLGTSWTMVRPCSNMELISLCIWPNAYIDWTATSGGNRDTVRNSTTGKSLLGALGGVVGGNSPCLWMEGPAGNIASGLNLAATSEPWFCSDRAAMSTTTI